MIDRKKVIKGLEEISDYFFDIYRNNTDSYKCEKVQEYSDVAIDAITMLKEQEPLEPIRVIIDQAGPLYHRCYCKKCGHHVGNMIKNKLAEAHENFCSKCGQAVKWND
jgi:hypothetical protein